MGIDRFIFEDFKKGVGSFYSAIIHSCEIKVAEEIAGEVEVNRRPENRKGAEAPFKVRLVEFIFY